MLTFTDEGHQGQVNLLSEAWAKGDLRIVVGAGASIQAGGPSWETLVARLGREYFSSAHSGLRAEPEEVEEFCRAFSSKFGRDAVVDIFRAHFQGRFHQILDTALQLKNQELASIHFELAAHASRASPGVSTFVTFNYDDLIERAISAIRDDLADDFESICDVSEPKKGVRIYHLHGMFGNEGTPKGTIVLSEKDYLNDADGWASRKLTDLLQEKKVLLLVGLSMSDPRLRRLIYETKRSTAPTSQIHVIFAQPEPAPSIPPNQRRSIRLSYQHEREYWKSWGVDVIGVRNHGLIEAALRRIRYPNQSNAHGDALAFLRAETNRDPRARFWGVGDLYNTDRQTEANQFLARTIEQVRTLFAVRTDEQLQLGLFVPIEDSRLRLAFHRKEGFVRLELSNQGSQAVTARWADQRTLAVADESSCQGVAGLSFVQGVVLDASGMLDRNFSAEMSNAWRSGRTVRSLTCVPVLDGTRWLPIAVAFIGSNFQEPFWTKLSQGDRLDLNRALRSMARNLLGLRSRSQEAHHG